MLLWRQRLKLAVGGEGKTTHRGVKARGSILLADRVELGEVVAEFEEFCEVIVARTSDEGVCVQVLRPCLTLLLSTLHVTRKDAFVVPRVAGCAEGWDTACSVVHALRFVVWCRVSSLRCDEGGGLAYRSAAVTTDVALFSAGTLGLRVCDVLN